MLRSAPPSQFSAYPIQNIDIPNLAVLKNEHTKHTFVASDHIVCVLIKTNVSRGSVSVWQVAPAESSSGPSQPRSLTSRTFTQFACTLLLHPACTPPPALHCPCTVPRPSVPTVVCSSACPPVAPWSGGGPPPGHHPPPGPRTQELLTLALVTLVLVRVRVWCEAACNSAPSTSTEAPRHGGWAGGAATHLHTHQHTGGRPQLPRIADSGNDVFLVL